MTECPFCGGEETEWLDITGLPPADAGLSYWCNDCGEEFDTRERCVA